MENQAELIEMILRSDVFAVVGVSPNREKYGYQVFKDLKSGGYEVYPVNPGYDDIEGETCYPDLKSLPRKADVVDFVCPPPVTEKLVGQMEDLGITKAWMQPGAESKKAIEMCRSRGIDVLHDICIMVERKKQGC